MGLAVLPARLLGEMELLKRTILAGENPASVPGLEPHAPWAAEVLARHPEFAPDAVATADPAALDEVIEQEIGAVFARVLEHCAVFAADEVGKAAFDKFIESVGSDGHDA